MDLLKSRLLPVIAFFASVLFLYFRTPSSKVCSLYFSKQSPPVSTMFVKISQLYSQRFNWMAPFLLDWRGWLLPGDLSNFFFLLHQQSFDSDCSILAHDHFWIVSNRVVTPRGVSPGAGTVFYKYLLLYLESRYQFIPVWSYLLLPIGIVIGYDAMVSCYADKLFPGFF